MTRNRWQVFVIEYLEVTLAIHLAHPYYSMVLILLMFSQQENLKGQLKRRDKLTSIARF